MTIVEFADYQCPYCLRGEQTLRALAAEYGDKLRVVFKNEPLGFHEGAEPAAEAALEVRDEKGDAAFWALHDLLLQSQGDLDAETVARIAVDVGASGDKVRGAIASHAHRAELEADLDLADDLQADGTPHFFVNGVRVAGAQPKEAFEAIIDRQIPRAQALLKAGTPPDRVYDALTRDGLGAPEPPHMSVDGLPQTDPARGPATARVTLHEFGDFQCPYCAIVEPTLRRLETTYAGRLHDTLLADPRKLLRGDLDADARAIRLDPARWKTALDGDAHSREVDADHSAASAVGVEGTPAFVVVAAGSKEGYALFGAQPYAHFRRLVERALSESARVARDAPPAPARRP